MAPVQSRPVGSRRNFSGLFGKRRATTPAVSFDVPESDGSRWAAILGIMKTTVDLPVVPETPRNPNLVNFEDFYEGRGALVKARRPPSKECALFVVGLLDAGLAHDETHLLSLFGDKDQALLEELEEMYVSAGQGFPRALAGLLAQVRQKTGKDRKILRREYRVSPTFMVKESATLTKLEERSRSLFGVGLNVLAGPLTFLYKTRNEPESHCRRLMGLPIGKPRAARMAREEVQVEDDDDEEINLLFGTSQGAITEAPPFEPGDVTQAHVWGGFVWVPAMKKWVEVDTRPFVAPVAPAKSQKSFVFDGFAWDAKGEEWLKLKI